MKKYFKCYKKEEQGRTLLSKASRKDRAVQSIQLRAEATQLTMMCNIALAASLVLSAHGAPLPMRSLTSTLSMADLAEKILAADISPGQRKLGASWRDYMTEGLSTGAGYAATGATGSGDFAQLNQDTADSFYALNHQGEADGNGVDGAKGSTQGYSQGSNDSPMHDSTQEWGTTKNNGADNQDLRPGAIVPPLAGKASPAAHSPLGAAVGKLNSALSSANLASRIEAGLVASILAVADRLGSAAPLHAAPTSSSYTSSGAAAASSAAPARPSDAAADSWGSDTVGSADSASGSAADERGAP